MGTHFRKSARLRYGLPDRFCLLGGIPNPLENPLTTYNTAQGGFDGILREILQKGFLIPYYGEVLEMPNNKLYNFKNSLSLHLFRSPYIIMACSEKRFCVIKWEQTYFCYFP